MEKLVVPRTIIGLDWETFFDSKDKYSLRSADMTTTRYVRDPRFHAWGAAIRSNKAKRSRWYRTGGPLEKKLASIDWSKTALLCHHTHFDGLILREHFNHTPAYYYDTLSMARAIVGVESRADLDTVAKHLGVGSKVEGYLADMDGNRNPDRATLALLGKGAERDTDLMWHVFRTLLDCFPEEELDIIHHTVKMYVEPVFVVDKQRAERLHRLELQRKRRTVKKALKIPRLTEEAFEAGRKKLKSREIFAKMLRDAGVEPPLKISPTWLKKSTEERDDDKKFTYAFAKNDLAFLELQQHPSEEVRNLVEARLIVSGDLAETRPLRLIQHADPAFPVYLNYWGARTTGRHSGGDKANPQNLGRDGELRKCLLAAPGCVVLIGDSGQIEARLNAWFSGQWDLIQQFRDYDLGKGPDPYVLFAMKVFNRRSPKTVTKLQRFVGKVCILALGYQMGAPKFQYTLEVGQLGPRVQLDDSSMYTTLVDQYRTEMSAIRSQWYTMSDMLNHMMQPHCSVLYRDVLLFQHNRVQLPNEMHLRYPNLRLEERNDEFGGMHHVYGPNATNIYGGKLVENFIQATARILVYQQLLPLMNMYKLALLVHDEGVFMVPRKQSHKAKNELLEALSVPPDWCPDLPVAGEVGLFPMYTKM